MPPQTTPAARTIPPRRCSKRAATANMTPYIAPTIMCTIAPRMAGPRAKKNSFPAIASFIDVIMVLGEMNVEAMW